MEVNKEAIREALYGLLRYISLGGTSENCGEMTPYFDCLDELLSMWFNDFYSSPETLISDGVISREEENILSEFSQLFRISYPRGERRAISDIGQLQSDIKWQLVVHAAKHALERLTSKEL